MFLPLVCTVYRTYQVQDLCTVLYTEHTVLVPYLIPYQVPVPNEHEVQNKVDV
jgi:hypothetical protein